MDGLLGVAGMILTSDYGSFPHSLLPSGKRLHSYGKIHHFQWENPLLMVIFHSYVSHYQRVSTSKSILKMVIFPLKMVIFHSYVENPHQNPHQQVTYNELLNAKVAARDRVGMWRIVEEMLSAGLKASEKHWWFGIYIGNIYWDILGIYIGIYWEYILGYIGNIYWDILGIYIGIYWEYILGYIGNIYWDILGIYIGIYWEYILEYIGNIYWDKLGIYIYIYLYIYIYIGNVIIPTDELIYFSEG